MPQPWHCQIASIIPNSLFNYFIIRYTWFYPAKISSLINQSGVIATVTSLLLAWAIVIGFSKVSLQATFNVATSFPQPDVWNPFLLQSPSSTCFKRASMRGHSVSSTQWRLPLVLNGFLACSCYRLWINWVKNILCSYTLRLSYLWKYLFTLLLQLSD